MSSATEKCERDHFGSGSVACFRVLVLRDDNIYEINHDRLLITEIHGEKNYR